MMMVTTHDGGVDVQQAAGWLVVSVLCPPLPPSVCDSLFYARYVHPSEPPPRHHLSRRQPLPPWLWSAKPLPPSLPASHLLARCLTLSTPS